MPNRQSGTGRLGTDMANVHGGLIVASLVNAAFSRQDIPDTARRRFMVHLDESHNFTTATIADMLPETRKYGLGLTLAHQHVAQVDPLVFEAILGNAGSLIVFRLGANDTPVFLRAVDTVIAAGLINQPNHRAYARLMVEGERRGDEAMPPTSGCLCCQTRSTPMTGLRNTPLPWLRSPRGGVLLASGSGVLDTQMSAPRLPRTCSRT